VIFAVAKFQDAVFPVLRVVVHIEARGVITNWL
jgi:hypothetical protein